MTPFEFHTGFEVTPKVTGKGENFYESDCPFCGKERHFHFFEDTRYNCKVCGKSGNVYTMLGALLEECQSHTHFPDKSLPQKVYVENGVKWNPFNGTFVIPTYNHGKLNNLYKYVERSNRILGTPGLSATLFNQDEVTEDDIWLCEGHWDKLAADAIIGNNRPITSIGLPGANMFKPSFTMAFREKNVLLIFDNDKAGEQGLQKTLEVFRNSPQKPKSISVVEWPDDLHDGFDLRDHYIEHGRKSYTLLQPFIKEIDDDTVIKVTTENIIEDYTCNSYDKALDAFEQAFHTTSDMRATLAAVMASIYSIKIEGEQMWMRVIGPPGSGKTRIAKAVSASDYVVSKSTFTGIFSGWKEGSDDDDAGLVPLIADRTLIVKDADALLRQKDIERIMSELRDFYDKDSSVTYRNKVSRDYRNIKSTFIMCGTQVLRRVDQSYLGERFLAIEMDVTTTDQDLISRKVMERTLNTAAGKNEDPEKKIMSAMKGWINHLRERELDSTIPKEMQDLIIRLCTLTAYMRTQVDRTYRGQVASPAVPELPSRLIGQIVTATLSLSAVFGKNKADNEVFAIIQKILRDTINPRSSRYSICDALLENPGIDAFDLSELTGIKRTSLQVELEDLTELGYINCTKLNKGGPGRKRFGFFLNDKISSPLKDLH